VSSIAPPFAGCAMILAKPL